MRDDIIGGLKNAIERGESIENAIQSFISAGYPENEVRQAARGLTVDSALSDAGQSSKPVDNVPAAPKSPETGIGQIQKLPKPKLVQEQKQGVGAKTIIIFSAILVALVILLVLTIVFREKIAGLF